MPKILPQWLVRFFSQSLSVQWQTILVRLPRAVPLLILKYTSPEGPHPFVFAAPSRDAKRKIPVYVFVLTNSIEHSSLPVVIDFHGGGFFMGSALEQAPFCAKLARDLNAVVLSVDYRMGPIDKFPAAYEDAEDILSAVIDPSARGHAELREAVTKYLREAVTGSKMTSNPGTYRDKSIDLDASKVGISGFSSGGNLALNMALSTPTLDGNQEPLDAWKSRFPSVFPRQIPLLLYYPSLDCRQVPSRRPRPKNLPLGSKFWSSLGDTLHITYLPDKHSSHPRASPGLADVNEMLHPKARAQLVLAELDVLTEQGFVWTTKMKAQGRGAHVQLEQYMAMEHGWTQFPESWLNEKERLTRDEAWNNSVSFLRKTWEDSTSI